MKRLHVHIKVEDLNASIPFYAAMFGQAPDIRKTDYAKWMLDDPRANVSLSAHGGSPGIDHAGIQVETGEELTELAARLRGVDAGLMHEADASCCYATSNKYWARGPEGAVWELFRSYGETQLYGEEPDRSILAREIIAQDGNARR